MLIKKESVLMYPAKSVPALTMAPYYLVELLFKLQVYLGVESIVKVY